MEEEREKHIHPPRPHFPGVGKSQGLTNISRTVVQNKHQDVPNGAGGDGLQEQVLEEGLGLQERQAPPVIRDTFSQEELNCLDLVLWSEHFTSSLEVGSFFSWLLQDPGIWGLGVRGLGVGAEGLALGSLETGAGPLGIVKMRKGANKCKLTSLGVWEGLEVTFLILREEPAALPQGQAPQFTCEWLDQGMSRPSQLEVAV